MGLIRFTAAEFHKECNFGSNSVGVNPVLMMIKTWVVSNLWLPLSRESSTAIFLIIHDFHFTQVWFCEITWF
jgi:hypothetical protein